MTKQLQSIGRVKTRALHIAYHFPPRGFVGAFRNQHIVRELDALSQEQFIITARYKEGMPLPISDNIKQKIHLLPNIDYRLFSRFLPNRKRTANAAIYSTTRKSNLARKLMDSFPTNLIFGEGGIVYIIFGVFKAIHLIKNNQITHLFSYYRSHADHIIAAVIKKIFPQLIWVADFADAPVDPTIDNVFYKDFQHRCYRKLLKNANLVTTVSKGHGQLLRKYHTQVHVLYNGIEKVSFDTPIPMVSKHFTITYTGSLYGKRDPSALFAVLRDMLAAQKLLASDLRLVYAGKDHHVWERYLKKYQLEAYAETHQHLSQQAAQRLQRASQINLLLSWANPKINGWLTYKLYEYLLADRPILSVVTGSTDQELEEMIGQFNNGLVFYPQKEPIAQMQQFITAHYEVWQVQGHTTNTVSLKGLVHYEWKNQVRRLWTKLVKQRVLVQKVGRI